MRTVTEPSAWRARRPVSIITSRPSPKSNVLENFCVNIVQIWGLVFDVWSRFTPKTQTAFFSIAGERKTYVKQKALPVAEGFLLNILVIF
jgi:hypothetical protein